MARIAIVVEGGCVQEVIADQETDVLVIDRDTVGITLDDLITIEGKEGYVYFGITEADVDRERVEALFREAGKFKIKWQCPNGCETDVVLVCGGPANDRPDAPNIYFQMTTEGAYTNRLEDGTIGVPKHCYEHADMGCCNEPVCPNCLEPCIRV